MYADVGPLRQLRAMARANLPPRAFLKRDRGDALFVTDAPAFDPGLREIPGFQIERRGALMYLLPEPGWLLRWERKYRDPPGELCASLARFKGAPPSRENLCLFSRAAKLLDGRPSQGEIENLDRDLRQSAAVALRGGCGGGLYAAAILLHQLRAKTPTDERPNDKERKDNP